jgi:uncharacterized membrane protein YsdA (DUF1294 family)/cold shock CspA family protein
MRKKGKLRSWNDQKGFGFIDTGDGSKEVFLHISAFDNRNRRPDIGQYVAYTLSADKQGRPRAANATLPGDRVRVKAKRRWGTVAVIGAGLFLVVVGLSVALTKLPAWILGLYLAASTFTFIIYAMDKSAAKRGAWRTPESSLHWLSLVGGWPGGLVAQQLLRHKSKKQSFRTVFWATVILNCATYVWLLTPTGMETLQSWVDAGVRF